MTVPRQPFALAHLGLTASWLGAMGYSLGVVQPKVTRFFPDERQREEFLTILAHGNRWRVVALLATLIVTATAVLLTSPGAMVSTGYAAALVPHLAAAGVFAHVSWQHWPARVFALPAELSGYRRRLRALAWTMLGLVGTAFLAARAASLWQ